MDSGTHTPSFQCQAALSLCGKEFQEVPDERVDVVSVAEVACSPGRI